MRTKLATAIVAVALLAAMPAMATFMPGPNPTPVTPTAPWTHMGGYDELNLFEIYNALYGTTYTSNADLDSLQFKPDDVFFLDTGDVGQIIAKAKYAYLYQTFGWYQDNGMGGTVKHPLFTIWGDLGLLPDNPAWTATISPTGNFGFYDDPSSPAFWYSEKWRNAGKEDHLIGFFTPKPYTYLLAWEDKAFSAGSDKDFQDLVIEVYLGPIVPEPSTMVILGLGIAGMVVSRMRRLI